MLCPRCQRENTQDSVFCNICGARLGIPTDGGTEADPRPGYTEPPIQLRSGAEQPSTVSALETAPGFVGRHREIGELGNALESVLSGHGKLMMMVGEPGIGKTRTAQEIAICAENLGVRVLWGRCYEGEGAPPYWPWVQPLRSYVRSADPDQLTSTMGSGAADIASIVPELHQVLPDLTPPPQLEWEQARFRLFNSVATFLEKASQVQPLMIVLDDLHWADRSGSGG